MAKATSFAALNTFAITTLGCKVNASESNIIANDLLSYGLTQVDFTNSADLYIINTCSVTNAADAKSKNMIQRAIKRNPDALILVCGCYSQVNQQVQNDLKIDIVLGNKYKNNIFAVLTEFFQQHQRLVKVDNLLLEKTFENTKSDQFTHQTRAFIKIQDGCNFMCSYCIIPFTRGRQRSKSASLILEEIQDLVQNGYREIVLTGVNTAGYQDHENSFLHLLQAINNLPGQFRVRISSVEPFQISDQIITLITGNPDRFCQHWHICLQSGSDAVLKKMNRKYSTEQFTELVQKIRDKSPYSAITTDYICGFPTETDADHELSKQFLNRIQFAKIHVFPYSQRSFTPAARLKQLHDAVKKERVNEILKISETSTHHFLKQFVGQTVTVLFEQQEGEYWSGHAGEFFRVLVKTTEHLKNQMRFVQIQKIIFDQAIGSILSDHLEGEFQWKSRKMQKN